MRIIAKRTLKDFWERHPSAKTSLVYWHAAVRQAEWANPSAVRATFRSADFVGGNRVIFDIGGNNFRLVAHVRYEKRIVFVRFVGTHADYDRIDPETV